MARTPSEHILLLAPWRHDLLNRLIQTFAIIALFALVPGAIAAVRLAKPAILVIDVVAYLMLYPAYRLRRDHFVAAAVILVASQLIVGSTLMIEVGVEGASILWLLAPLILAHLLLGGRATLAVLTVSAAIMALTSVLLHLDRLSWTIPLTVWYSILGSFFTVAAIIILSSRYLIEHLIRGLTGEQTLNGELNHRVKNNLQLMGSLIQLHRSHAVVPEARETLTRLATRVTAMGRSFQLLDRTDGTLRVPAADLIAALMGDVAGAAPGTVRITHEWIDGPGFLGIDEAIPLAMILTELLTAAVAIPGEEPGEVSLTVTAPHRDRMEVRIGVTSGRTAPSRSEPLLTDPLSADIAAALAEQLSATIRESHDRSGLITVVAFPSAVSSPSAAP
jgi:two-component sensor histidine kinase